MLFAVCINPLNSLLFELCLTFHQGHDSTANVLSWFARFMEANIGVQTELRTALQSAFPGEKAPSADEILRADIPYLDGGMRGSLPTLRDR